MFEVENDRIEKSCCFDVDVCKDFWQVLNDFDSFREISGKRRGKEEDEGRADGLPGRLVLSDDGVFDDRPECEGAVVDGEGHVVVDLVADALPR